MPEACVTSCHTHPHMGTYKGELPSQRACGRPWNSPGPLLRKALDGANSLGSIEPDTGEGTEQLHCAMLLRAADAREFMESWHPEVIGTDFISPEWVLPSWENLTQLGTPAVAVVRDGDIWAAVALTENTTPKGRVFGFAGQPLGDEHDAALSAPSAARLLPDLRHLLERMAAEGADLVLDCLTTDGRLAQELSRAPRWNLEPMAAPVITLANMRVSAKGHARRLRNLGTLGSLRFDVVEGPDLTVAEGERFIRAKWDDWTRQGRIDTLPPVERLAEFPHFMGTAMNGLARRGLARLWTLRLNGDRLAEDLHIGPPSTPLIYMGSYSHDLRAYSPGRVLLEETLGQLAARGCAYVRMGRGDEAYKMEAGAGDETVLRATLVRG